MTRAAYAEAFPAVTGRPLIKLPQTAGRSESEIFFDALALNAADLNADGEAERLLEPFSAELAAALSARRDDLDREGQALPGAVDAVAAVAKLEGPGETTVQTVLTGSTPSPERELFQLLRPLLAAVEVRGSPAPHSHRLPAQSRRAPPRCSWPRSHQLASVSAGDAPEDCLRVRALHGYVPHADIVARERGFGLDPARSPCLRAADSRPTRSARCPGSART